jgi:hypothetical protein
MTNGDRHKSGQACGEKEIGQVATKEYFHPDHLFSIQGRKTHLVGNDSVFSHLHVCRILIAQFLRN